MPKPAAPAEMMSSGVNLLISILVRYPEIATVHFDPKHDTMQLTFMFKNTLDAEEFRPFRAVLADSLSAYHRLERLKVSRCDIELQQYEQIAILTIYRDVHTFTKNEIALLISLLRDSFKEQLIIDTTQMPEDDLQMQEEVIEDILLTLKKQQAEQNLIGIREDGRVLVFNK